MISPFLIFLHIKTLMPLLYIPILLSIVLLVSGYVAFKGSNKNVILQFIHCDTNNKIVGILFLHLANNNNANRISRNILYFLNSIFANKLRKSVPSQSCNIHPFRQFGSSLVCIADKKDVLRIDMFDVYQVSYLSYDRRCFSTSCTADHQTVIFLGHD